MWGGRERERENEREKKYGNIAVTSLPQLRMFYSYYIVLVYKFMYISLCAKT